MYLLLEASRRACPYWKMVEKLLLGLFHIRRAVASSIDKLSGIQGIAGLCNVFSTGRVN